MLVAATGKKFNGRQQIAEYYTNYFKQARALKSVDIGPDEAHAMGDGAIWAVGQIASRSVV